ncbi:low affinity immunoglobulin gamma Fc region receptor III-B-like isoform X2 [Neolamprologus brichardi]|uniref:low affinity immunoglobulin gamma Fc region receptor III-B-like isoform X1 n=1 Tax=Neolamprologus brichardi TaxID=32507 RepID=UPI001643B9DC|nr:low affinity immunoglobulin gamma Fc region receptor III-B-like isoform X1 [Neolamprologus brichardi]XP_035765677.1 low affinity immunoglobulin gamma Fc region receptor III-B-like isoform X2 [Neolamprologus brichardi]
MDKLISLFVFSALSQIVVSHVPTETSFRANIELVSGHLRIFSRERAHLRCSIPDVHRSNWTYLWFRGSEELSQTGEELNLWNTKVQESGKYYCQGTRNTKVGKIRTQQSVPVELKVDGGWAILQVPRHPQLVGSTLEVTCRVRGNPRLEEIILYKDGVEVMRQNGHKPDFYLTNLSLEDLGVYSCRASWDVRRQTLSVISAGAHVQILEVLSQPVLEIIPNYDTQLKRMKLICHVQYNAPAPAPPIDFYFYKNNRRLGPATSDNYNVVKQTPGLYSCKARVPQLDLSKSSEPKNFGQIRATDDFPPAASLPTSPNLSSHQPIQFTPVKSTPSQGPPLKTSQAVPTTLLTTDQVFNSATTQDQANPFEESGDMSGDSQESGDMSGDSADSL